MLDLPLRQLASLNHPGADYNDVVITVHQLMKALRAAEAEGQGREDIRRRVAPAWDLHAASPFIRRLQTWPRGYPGDFETIEYLCDAQVRAPEGSLAYALERYALNCDAAQQHRNKVACQGRMVLEAFRRGGADARVLSLACGGSRDIAPFAAELAGYGGTLVINDMDADAVALTRRRLARLGERLVEVPGNVLRKFDAVAAQGPFDLAVAGGLFDYLPRAAAAHLIRGVWRALKPGGRFFWTNIATGNPYRLWIENLAEWVLIERSAEDVLAIAALAGIPADRVSITREETGLTLLVTLTRED